MSQCVPNWEVEERSDTPRLPYYRGPNSHPTSEHPPQQPMYHWSRLEYFLSSFLSQCLMFIEYSLLMQLG